MAFYLGSTAVGGTHVDANSLSVASKVDCGTFTFDTDQTSNFDIQHNLGAIPDMICIWATGGIDYYRNSTFAAQGNGIVNPSFVDEFGYAASLQRWSGVQMRAKVSADPSAQTGAGGSANGINWPDATATKFTCKCSASYPFKAGVTYVWIALLNA